MKSSCSSLALLLAFSNFHTLSAQVTPRQTISFDSDGDGTFTDFPGPGVNLGAGQPLDTFTKFDPSLGTLTEVLFTVQVSGSVEAILSAEELLSPEDPFSIALDSGPEDYIQASIIYGPTGDTSGYSLTFDLADIPFLGVEGIDPSEYGAPEGFYFEEFGDSFFGGYSDGGETLSEGNLLVSNPAFNPVDFIGTGNVTGLSFDAFAAFGSFGNIDNLAGAFLEASIYFDAGNATIQYVYTPVGGTPPPPTITNYSKSDSTHTLIFTGETGKSDWAVKGGTDTMTFPTDHTATTIITETSPGIFQAVITLSELLEPKYFLRIE